MSLLSQFRAIAFLEGLSFIILLFIAMPLKYMYGMPMAVKIVGMAHGVLFIAFCLYLFLLMNKYEMKFSTAGLGFISALIPFGTFFFDFHIRKQLSEDKVTE